MSNSSATELSHKDVMRVYLEFKSLSQDDNLGFFSPNLDLLTGNC